MCKTLCRILILLIGLSYVLIAAPKGVSELPNYKLYRSENPIHTDTPIVKQNGHFFVPLRDLMDTMDGKVNFNRKENAYTVTLPTKKRIALRANTTLYKSKKQNKHFSKQPFIYKTRLYVPLKDILQLMGHSAAIQKQNIYIVNNAPPIASQVSSYKPPKTELTPQKKQKVVAKATPTQSTLYLFKTDAVSINPKNYKLPHINKQANNTLHVLGKNYNLSALSTYKNNRLYIDFRSIFLNNNYKIKTLDTGFILSKEDINYTFNTKEHTLKVQTKTNTSTKKLDYRIYTQGKQLLFPLKQFSHDIGLSPHWDHKKRTLFLLNRISSISLSKYKDTYILHTKSHHKLNVSGPYTLTKPYRLYWDIPYTTFNTDQLVKTIPKENIKKVSIGKHPKKVRLVVHLETPLTAETNYKNESVFVTLQPKTTHTPSIAKQAVSKHINALKKAPKVAPKKIKSSLRGKIIAIDPGHGGIDPGAIGLHKEKEKVYTLDISLRLKKQLEARGARVVIARTTDKNPSLNTRTKLANRSNADAFLSIHINSFIKSYAKGTETYYYKPKDKQLSREIQKHLVSKLGLKNNGIKKSRMFVLRHSKMPSALIEPCFITNPTENYLIKQASFRQKIADGIINGLESYFSKQG